MSDGDFPMRVPIGDDAGDWISVPFTRTVLVVARTAGATLWLLEFLGEVFGDDPRVQVVFTIDEDWPSAFHRGARDLLARVGAAMVPWEQACETEFDLALTSTHRGALAKLRAPLFITPHGPGFGKPGSVLTDGHAPMARPRRRSGAAVLTTVVVTHDEDTKLVHPDRDVRVLVAGDPAYDSLRASLPGRARYRRQLGVVAGQRLALLSSTWGPGAQLGTVPDLAARLALELPADEWAVAMIIHPNIWFGHSPWQVRTWLRSPREMGVLAVCPDGDDWRSALIASDVVVADHGSVALYGAALGRPVLTAGFQHTELRADAPLAELGEQAPRLELSAPLGPQLEEALATTSTARHRAPLARTFGGQKGATACMQAAIYDQLGLSTPDPPARILAVRASQSRFRRADAHIVTGQVGNTATDAIEVQVDRRPVGPRHREIPGGGGGGDTSLPAKRSSFRHCWRLRRSLPLQIPRLPISATLRHGLRPPWRVCPGAATPRTSGPPMRSRSSPITAGCVDAGGPILMTSRIPSASSSLRSFTCCSSTES